MAERWAKITQFWLGDVIDFVSGVNKIDSFSSSQYWNMGSMVPFCFHGELLSKLRCGLASDLETLASLPRIDL